MASTLTPVEESGLDPRSAQPAEDALKLRAPAPDRAAIERYFEVSLYLLIVIGFATLVTTGRLDALSILFVGGALALRGWQLFTRHTLLIPERWTTWFTLLYVVFYAADFLVISGTFVSATVHLVLFSMVVKVFSVQRDRDHLYLAVLAFLEVLAAAVLTVDSLFLFFFCLFMLAAVTTFISMEMRRAAARAAVMGKRVGEAAQTSLRLRSGHGPGLALRLQLRRMPAALTSTAFAIMLSIFAASALIFFLLPRVSAGYLGAFAPRNELVSGFSDDINLGQIGVIQQSNAVVMHVTIEGAHGDALNLKWRGTALDTFDGVRWTSAQHIVGNEARRGLERSFNLGRLRGLNRIGPEPVSRRYRPLRYRVLMEPVGVNYFFLVPAPDLLYGNYSAVRMDPNDAVSDEDRDHPITAYQALSNIAEPTPEELRTAGQDYPLGLGVYLAKPFPIDARIPALAERVTAQASTPYDKAVALEEFLRTSFAYTLELPQTPPRDPLANFLFERKQGHCEYFASSMAMMLRTLGIPSRIVNGFRTGEYNDLTGSYIIRARNAHSWVEAYFPGYGWVEFDPTPGGTAGAVQISGWARAALYVDALREFWREWIINYDFAHQRTLTTQVTVSTRQIAENARRWVRRQYQALIQRAHRMRDQAARSPAQWWGSALALLGVALGLVNAARLRRAWQRRTLARAPERAPRAAAGLWYERMTRALARRGWRKLPVQSAREFVVTIEDPALRDRVESFTDTYERARFGGSAEDAKQLPELYEEVLK